ncbi:MAG: chalcone isomerase family protein [Gammaproteobacteria bacterium]
MSRNAMINTLNRWYLSALVALITLGPISTAHAAMIAGVSLPDQAQVAGKTVVLNGMGLRTATLLKVKVYVIGLYLESKSSDPQAIIASEGNKRIIMHFLHDVSAEKLRTGWSEGFKDNSGDVAAIEDEIVKFNASMRDVKKGESIVLDFADDTVDVLINGTRIDSVAGKAFQQALLAIWLGPKPPNDALKQGILGH